MNVVTIVLVAVAAGLGGAARHGINGLGWGWRGTLLANVTGSFALGWLTGTEPSSATVAVVGTGFFGALTTFSMFAIEVTEAPPLRRVAIIATNVVAGLTAAATGYALA